MDTDFLVLHVKKLLELNATVGVSAEGPLLLHLSRLGGVGNNFVISLTLYQGTPLVNKRGNPSWRIKGLGAHHGWCCCFRVERSLQECAHVDELQLGGCK